MSNLYKKETKSLNPNIQLPRETLWKLAVWEKISVTAKKPEHWQNAINAGNVSRFRIVHPVRCAMLALKGGNKISKITKEKIEHFLITIEHYRF